MESGNPASDSLLTIAQAAQLLGVSPGLVYRLTTGRQLKHVRVGIRRGTIRIPESEINRYLREREK